ncbi:MAG: M48 family metalloprotease [Elainellaceae cyanobacterium]
MNTLRLIQAASTAIAAAVLGASSLPMPALSAPEITNPLSLQAPPKADSASHSLIKNANESQYEQARTELPEDYYVLYRVIERLSRANQLDSRPWRVLIAPDYDINAFATDVNLLAFYNGLLDQIHGDPNALACVVGHEMAHHTEEHIALAAAEQETRLQALRQEAVDEVASEEEDLEDDLRAMGVGEWVSGNAGTLAAIAIPEARGTGGRIGNMIGGMIGGQIRRDRERRLERAVERIEQIYAEKEAQFIAAETERNHAHEFEADEMGYQYMVRAGFEPQGCVTMLEALNRIPGSQRDSMTHPATPARISGIQAMGSQYPSAALEAEGNANLSANPTALTYDLSRDGNSLRINSRSGSSDIDDLLPQ